MEHHHQKQSKRLTIDFPAEEYVYLKMDIAENGTISWEQACKELGWKSERSL